VEGLSGAVGFNREKVGGEKSIADDDDGEHQHVDQPRYYRGVMGIYGAVYAKVVETN
jgi:hypothetical protein